jgi:hypothetical protein
MQVQKTKKEKEHEKDAIIEQMRAKLADMQDRKMQVEMQIMDQEATT